MAPSTVASSASLNYQANFRKRFWLSAGAGRSSLSPDVSQAPSVGIIDDKDTGGQVGLGFDVSPRVAVELHAAMLGWCYALDKYLSLRRHSIVISSLR